jgi:hypothetical protein
MPANAASAAATTASASKRPTMPTTTLAPVYWRPT